MKKKQHEVFIILGALIALSFGIGILHGDEKEQQTVLELTQNSKDYLKSLEPLIESRSVEKIAKSLTVMPVEQIGAIVRKILSDQNTLLTRNDKLTLIFALSTEFARDPRHADYFFSVLRDYPQLIINGEPLLYVMAKSYYDPLMPQFITWLSQHEPLAGIPSVAQMLEQAGMTAVQKRSLGGSRRLFTRGLAFTKQQLNNYLWMLTQSNGNPGLVEVLVAAGADKNVIIKGSTPLFNAVKNDNLPMVNALIKVGVDVNYIADKSLGSPLQEALGQGLTPIELALRKAGARE
ncbi:hypothetical protein Noda2021_10860 [Candidatus Dependentiae bacterium Noda2021]|nr:hypothetical protein Noda2021_10860 [Candidatus Dependentiae bacterium Noda2021]